MITTDTLYRTDFSISLFESDSSVARPAPQQQRFFPACNGPTDIFDPYRTVTFLPSRDNKPIPITYTHKNRKAHRLSVIDIDARDTQMDLFIDNLSYGVTRDFELNKELDCGEDLRFCLEQGFSAGVLVVPPGKHTVKIAWAGKGKCYFRRFWKVIEYSSQISSTELGISIGA